MDLLRAVVILLVLSGWLLGGLLFKEAEKIGRINIEEFWAMRWMTTLPAYYKENLEFSSEHCSKVNMRYYPHRYFQSLAVRVYGNNSYNLPLFEYG
jgi:hypothetical protein